MIRWIRDPQDLSPLTAMPDLDVEEVHARDMATYLLTLLRELFIEKKGVAHELPTLKVKRNTILRNIN